MDPDSPTEAETAHGTGGTCVHAGKEPEELCDFCCGRTKILFLK